MDSREEYILIYNLCNEELLDVIYGPVWLLILLSNLLGSRL
jgi:hypothetical protein